jgi:hypothetical protein
LPFHRAFVGAFRNMESRSRVVTGAP